MQNRTTDSVSESKEAPSILPIRVISLDFDKCIFNNKYCFAYASNKCASQSEVPVFEEKDDPLFTANQNFFEKVKEECSQNSYQELILMMGSLRQSEFKDMDLSSRVHEIFNSIGGIGLTTESCFSALTKIKDKLNRETKIKCKLDDFLLPDLCNDDKDGTHFKKALANNHLRSTTYEPESCPIIHDENKILLLYVQLNRIASQYPTNQIIFDFYDDSEKILENLSDVFTTYPTLIPTNLKLCLHHYYEGHFTNKIFTPIQGTGEIDFNYKENAQLLVQTAQGDKRTLKEYDENTISLYELMAPEHYDSFIKNRQLNKKDCAQTLPTAPSPSTTGLFKSSINIEDSNPTSTTVVNRL